MGGVEGTNFGAGGKAAPLLGGLLAGSGHEKNYASSHVSRPVTPTMPVAATMCGGTFGDDG
ncbi:MAG: hypothetical protein R6U98_36025 [Pirellulaceae bacterium]